MEERNEVKAEVSYSAETQKQIAAIRAKYVRTEPAEARESALEQMKRLDARVESKAQIVGLAVGILSTLVLGAGMSAVMVGSKLLIGIPVGVIGLVGIVAAFPLYRRTLKREREKVAPEIIRLSEENSINL